MSRAADGCAFQQDVELADDPALQRLLAMGFRVNEVKRPLAQARAEGDPDPVRFVLGHLIQGRARR